MSSLELLLADIHRCLSISIFLFFPPNGSSSVAGLSSKTPRGVEDHSLSQNLFSRVRSSFFFEFAAFLLKAFDFFSSIFFQFFFEFGLPSCPSVHLGSSPVSRSIRAMAVQQCLSWKSENFYLVFFLFFYFPLLPRGVLASAFYSP